MVLYSSNSLIRSERNKGPPRPGGDLAVLRESSVARLRSYGGASHGQTPPSRGWLTPTPVKKRSNEPANCLSSMRVGHTECVPRGADPMQAVAACQGRAHRWVREGTAPVFDRRSDEPGVQGHPAVDDDGGPGDVAGLVAGHPGDRGGD